jgi:hypothetical protein
MPLPSGPLTERPPIRGWLVVYLVALAGLAAHGLELTVASLIIGADPSLAGLTSFVPVPALVFYVASNAVLILYTVFLFVLMVRRRRSAIAHNVVFNALSVAFLLGWHLLHMKSTLGVTIDIVPNLVMAAYMVTSRRVRRTFRGPERPGRPGRPERHRVPASARRGSEEGAPAGRRTGRGPARTPARPTRVRSR